MLNYQVAFVDVNVIFIQIWLFFFNFSNLVLQNGSELNFGLLTAYHLH